MADWTKIASEIQGTSLASDLIAEKYGVDKNEVESQLEEQGIGFCANCGKWTDESNLDWEDYCDECGLL